MPFDRAFGIVCVACEASSESALCQQAVAASLRNSVKAGRWEPTVAGVVSQRYQFSEFLPDSGDNNNLERVVNMPETAPDIVAAAAAYDAVMADPNLDPSEGSTHFYADGIPTPNWAVAPAELAVKIGRVNFYKGVK